MTTPIYALDFDGVICDSAIETSITGWKAAQTLWADMVGVAVSDNLIQQFRCVRPLLETGYEAILIMRLLHNGVLLDDLLQHYDQRIARLIEQENLDTKMLKQLFGETRDTWIQANEDEWLNKNPLFDGVAEKLQRLEGEAWYIITTKQERFVKRILKGNGVTLSETCIFGMERQLNKQQVLQQLLEKHPDNTIVFIEDRLPTLLGILQNQELDALKLQLVDWGYNTPADKERALSEGIELIECL